MPLYEGLGGDINSLQALLVLFLGNTDVYLTNLISSDYDVCGICSQFLVLRQPPRRLSENRESTAEKLNLAIFPPNFR